MPPRKNLVGKKFGELLVKAEHSKSRNGHYRYVCECDCGRTKNVLGTHLIQGNSTTCGAGEHFYGKRSKLWRGKGALSAGHWARIMSSVNKYRTHIEVSIDLEYASDLYEEQDRKCALTGVSITMPDHGTDTTWTASLDRIDSSKGYEDGNVQWVHKDINMMKNSLVQKRFIELCKMVAQYND